MTRRIIGVLLAIVLAIGGTAAVFAYVSTAEERVAAGVEAVQVVLANERIPAGTSGARLRDQELVREVVMPRDSVPDGALTSTEELADLEDQVVTADLHPDQLLMRGAFGPPARLTGGLAVPDTKVAVSVRIEVHQQVAGYVRPGSHIAIFNTYDSNDDDDELEEGADNTRTRLLLQRVEVLAVGVFGDGGVTTAATDDDEEEERFGLVLTVAVDQNEAERLIHATRTGQLYLALLTDTSEIEPGPGVDSRTLFP